MIYICRSFNYERQYDLVSKIGCQREVDHFLMWWIGGINSKKVLNTQISTQVWFEISVAFVMGPLGLCFLNGHYFNVV